MPGSNATGLMLALLTALFWGALPLALKHLLSTVDALSIVCLRFWVAAAWTWGLSCRHPGNSTPLGRREKILLVLAAGALLLQGYQIMVLAANSVGGGALAMYGCYCAALIVPAGVSCWAFPLLSRFQMGLGHLLVTSFQVTLRHLPQTLLLILLLFVTVWTTAGFFPLAVFTPALNALLASMPAERVIRRYLPEKEPEGEEL